MVQKHSSFKGITELEERQLTSKSSVTIETMAADVYKSQYQNVLECTMMSEQKNWIKTAYHWI